MPDDIFAGLLEIAAGLEVHPELRARLVPKDRPRRSAVSAEMPPPATESSGSHLSADKPQRDILVREVPIVLQKSVEDGH